MYRIKQNSANYRTFSLSIKAGNLRLYHYAGNNPIRYIDPDGKQQFPSGLRDIFDFLYIAGDPYSKIYNEMKLADSGDEYAKAYLKYTFHEAGREVLKETSSASNDLALMSLCIGFPEGSAFFGGVATACDITLAIDDWCNRKFLDAGKESILIVAGFISSIVLKTGVNALTKSINITVGNIGKFYEVGCGNMIRSEDEIIKLIIKDISSGYFGQEIIPNTLLIIQEVNKVYKELKEGNDE